MKKRVSLCFDENIYKKYSEIAHSIGKSTSSMIEDYMRIHLDSQRGVKFLYPELLKKENKNDKVIKVD